MQGKKLQGSPLHCKAYRVNDGLYTPLGHKAAVKLKHWKTKPEIPGWSKTIKIL